LHQGRNRDDLADATAEPAATMQRDECPAERAETRFRREGSEEFRALHGGRDRPSRYFEEQLLLAITE
jgi:hypothetical protein